MNVDLTPEMEKIVNGKVASGMYDSASEVVREALRLMNEQDEIKSIRLENLRSEIRLGIEASDEGDVTEGRKAMSDIREELIGKYSS